MKNKLAKVIGMFCLVMGIGLLGATSVNSALLNCEFQLDSSSCSGVELFNTYKTRYNASSPLQILNSNVLLPSLNSSSSYDQTLCCKATEGSLNKKIISRTDDCGSSGWEPLLWFKDDINSRVSIHSGNASSHDYKYKLCVKPPAGFSDFNLEASNIKEGGVDFSTYGYTCLFRTSDELNGQVSSCNATYETDTGKDKYNYIVWGKLKQNPNTIRCNDDCASKMDGRVYKACKNALPSKCADVPPQCDGVKEGSWIKYNGTHEIKCTYPWDSYREKVFKNRSVDIRSTNCNNVIKQNYNVVYNNQEVQMNIYVCKE